MSQEFRFHNNIDALVYLDTSAEQHALFIQAFELAKLRIDAALAADRLVDGAKQFCVISDLDETLLDNSAYNAWLVRYGRNFSETKSWRDYCAAMISKATPGAVDFLNFVQSKKDQRGNPIEIFYVTSRLDDAAPEGGIRGPTAHNLKSLGYPLPDASNDPTRTHLFMKKLVVTPTGGDTKYDHYAYIAAERHCTPIVWLGDNLSDFRADYGNKIPSAHRLASAMKDPDLGRRFIAFPNPAYGSFLLSLRTRDDVADPVLQDDDQGAVAGYDRARPDRTPETTPKMAALDVWDFDPDAGVA